MNRTLLASAGMLMISAWCSSLITAAAPHPDPHVVAALSPSELAEWVTAMTNNGLTVVNFFITAYHLVELARQKEWAAWWKLRTRRKLKPRPKPAK